MPSCSLFFLLIPRFCSLSSCPLQVFKAKMVTVTSRFPYVHDAVAMQFEFRVFAAVGISKGKSGAGWSAEVSVWQGYELKFVLPLDRASTGTAIASGWYAPWFDVGLGPKVTASGK